MTFDDAQAFVDAAFGSADAQMKLCDDAIAYAAGGRIPIDEALITAELLARLATLSGNPVHYVRLAGILYWRSQHAADHGDDERARAFEIEATGTLAMADEMGCEDAGDILASWAHVLRPETLPFLASNQSLFLAGRPSADRI